MCRQFWVSGKVQGVGYRAFARRAATELALNGHAHNLPDGRVHVLACGDPAALARYAERLRNGPRWSAPESMEQSEAPCCEPGFSTA